MAAKVKAAVLPVRVENLGSPAGVELDFSREELWARMDAPMGKKAVEVPVYLVNPNQMDVLYPPERLRFLDPKAVHRWAQRMREQEGRGEGEERPPLWGLEGLPSEAYREVVAVGLYAPELYDDQRKARVLQLAQGEAPGAGAFQREEGPAIFLCPERILAWAGRAGMDPHLVQDKVYYHELSHALMDTGPTPYGELWGRIVEESLANWVAVGRFRGLEARQVQRLILDQPAEYQGYAALEDLLPEPLLAWEEPWWEEFWWRLRHRVRPFFWEEWRDLLRWAHRRGLPLWPLFPWQADGGLGRLIYRWWREAKRREAFRDGDVAQAWARYAEALLLRALE